MGNHKGERFKTSRQGMGNISTALLEFYDI